MSNIPDDAERSEDGQWWWDGSAWQPVGGATPTENYESAETYESTENYAAAANPGQPWRTPPNVEGALEDAWDYTKEKAGEAWDWASGGSDTGETPTDGGGGGEGAPPYHEGGDGGQGGYSDGGLPPGGVPEQQPCDLGPCPTCGEELSMSSPCVFQKGHDGDHECAQDHAWEQADAYSAPLARRCDARCQYYDENNRQCEKHCIRKFMHYPPEHLCNLGHTW